MRKKIVKGALIAFFMLSSLAMIQPKAYAQSNDVIVLTASQMEVGALFARLLEDIHMYALMKTNPLTDTTTQSNYINALTKDGLETLPSAIAAIISETNSGVATNSLAKDINVFFDKGVEYVNSVVEKEDTQLLIGQWKELATNIFTAAQPLTNPSNLVNQLINAASAQVVQYFEHTQNGYEQGLNYNCGSIQFAIAFGLALVNNNSNL